MSHNEFGEILSRVERGESATLTREVEGTLHARRFVPRERLILLGGGHVALALAQMAAMLDFAVTVVDDRPSFANAARFPEAEAVVCDGFEAAIAALGVRASDYVCVLTRGHRWDGECLRALLAGVEPSYLGMIGSKRRVAGLLGALAAEGCGRDALARIHAPIGLMIGAVTPAEIAVSICAQLVEHRRAKAPQTERARAAEESNAAPPQAKSITAPPSAATALEQTNTDLAMLRLLAHSGEKKALCLVLATDGSTPVRDGAVMAVDALGRGYGTIGGGCGEAAVMTRARSLLGTGESCVMSVDMTADASGGDGLACGGTMRVYIEDLSV